MISPSQRPLPDNTQHSQQTNIHASGGIRTNNLSRRAAKNLRLKPRGHWDRHLLPLRPKYLPQHPIPEHPQLRVPPATCETKFHIHTKQQANLQFCVSWSSYFKIAVKKAKNSALNKDKLSLSSVCSSLFREWNFDIWWLFPNMWTLPTFQRIYYLSLYCDFALHYIHETWTDSFPKIYIWTNLHSY